MKGLVVVGFLLCLFPAFGQDSTFSSANEAYANGEYTAALNGYNQLIADENRSVQLYYNLGNTYYRLNEWGKAVWAYERALKINPSHVNSAFNLNFVNQQTKAEINHEQGGIGSWLKAHLFGISINFWAYFSLIFGGCFALTAYFFLTTKNQKIKNVSLSASLITFVLLIGGIGLAYYNALELTTKTEGIIIVRTAAIQSEPTEDSESNFDLKEGAKVQLLRTTADWIEIDFKGHSGWVSRNEIWEI